MVVLLYYIGKVKYSEPTKSFLEEIHEVLYPEGFTERHVYSKGYIYMFRECSLEEIMAVSPRKRFYMDPRGELKKFEFLTAAESLRKLRRQYI